VRFVPFLSFIFTRCFFLFRLQTVSPALRTVSPATIDRRKGAPPCACESATQVAPLAVIASTISWPDPGGRASRITGG
jgi:hypothetical protein